MPDTEQPTAEQQGKHDRVAQHGGRLWKPVSRRQPRRSTRALQNAPEHTVDGAERERRELRSRSRLGRWFEAAISGRNLSGAEAEVATAYGCPDAIPLEMFERRAASGQRTETRAVTPAPSTTDENLAGIVPALFDRSAASWLGVEMPVVPTGDAGYPVLSTSVTGGVVAKSAAAAETAGAFTVTMAQPRRVTGSFRFLREDAARLNGMEAALRANIESVLSDEIDKLVINGSGTGDGAINGLLAILDNPTAPVADQETFARYVAAAASHVDGLFAVDLSGIRQLVGVATYAHMASAFRSNNDSMTAEGWLIRPLRRRPHFAAHRGGAVEHSASDRALVESGRGSRGSLSDLEWNRAHPRQHHVSRQRRNRRNRASLDGRRCDPSSRLLRSRLLPAGLGHAGTAIHRRAGSAGPLDSRARPCAICDEATIANRIRRQKRERFAARRLW